MDLKETKLSSEPIYEGSFVTISAIGCACPMAMKANEL